MSSIGLKEWLTFSVIAAVISTVGGLVGIALRDRFFARSFERWKRRQSLRHAYERFRDPLLLAARELSARLLEILDVYPAPFLRSSVLSSSPGYMKTNSADDPHYRRYKLISTIYRVCAFLGWIELYRREVVFLNPGRDRQAKRLEKCVETIRADFADGQLNVAPNWHEWQDRLIFREELRAIGECMLEGPASELTVVGYGAFAERLGDESAEGAPRWLRVVFNFLLDLDDSGKDFRKTRIERLAVHTVDLMEELSDTPLDRFFSESRSDLARQLG